MFAFCYHHCMDYMHFMPLGHGDTVAHGFYSFGAPGRFLMWGAGQPWSAKGGL